MYKLLLIAIFFIFTYCSQDNSTSAPSDGKSPIDSIDTSTTHDTNHTTTSDTISEIFLDIYNTPVNVYHIDTNTSYFTYTPNHTILYQNTSGHFGFDMNNDGIVSETEYQELFIPPFFNVNKYYDASGWMGDFMAAGKKTFDCSADQHYAPSKDCHHFRFSKHAANWAGIYWLRDHNW